MCVRKSEVFLDTPPSVLTSYLDGPQEKFKCFLYGDRRLAPASGVPGECFTLRDRLDDLRHEDVDEDFFEDHKDDGKEIKFGECGSCSRWQEGCTVCKLHSFPKGCVNSTVET